MFVMLVAVTAEARHFHASGSAQRCTVCVTAHSPTLISQTASVTPESISAPLVPPAQKSIARSLAVESHSIRPPPPSA